MKLNGDGGWSGGDGGNRVQERRGDKSISWLESSKEKGEIKFRIRNAASVDNLTMTENKKEDTKGEGMNGKRGDWLAGT